MDQERRAHTADVQQLTDDAARATADAAEQRALVDAAQVSLVAVSGSGTHSVMPAQAGLTCVGVVLWVGGS